MVASDSDKVIKTVSRKLKHYFEVKRLEDGFDLSGVDAPKLDHPPLKARPTLQYDGLHDRPLKHYFGDRGVRVRLTKWAAPPNQPKQKAVKKKMISYMDDMKFVHPYLPDYSYVHYPRGKMILRPNYQGFGVQLPKTKKPHKGGYPVLRTRPSHQVSKTEANRLVNMASHLLVNSQCVDDGERSRSLSRDRGTKSSSTFSRASSARPANRRGVKPRAQSAKSPKYVYDIHGRRVRADAREQADEDARKYHYVERDEDDEKPMPRWLKREIKKRDQEEGEDVQKRYVRPGSSVSAGSGRPGSGRPGSGRPGSGRPGSGRPGSGRPGSGRASDDGRPQSQAGERPLSARKERTAPSRMDRIVTSGIQARYRVFVRTGMKLGASTDADVFITLYGTKGRSEEIVLLDSKSHKAKFRKSQEDEFHINTYHVGALQHVKIGHNRKELGAGWFLESVVVVDLHDRISYTFPCNRWLSYREEDQKTKRVLETSARRNLPPDSELTDSEDEGSRSPSPPYSSPSTRSPSPPRPGARSPTPHSGRPDSSHTSMNANPSSDGRAVERAARPREEDTEFSDSEPEPEPVESPRQVQVQESPESPRKSADSPEPKRTSSPERKGTEPSDDYNAGYKDGLAAARSSPPPRTSSPTKSRDSPTRPPPSTPPRDEEGSQASDDGHFCIHTAAKEGRLHVVKNIVHKDPETINAVSEEGVTALHLASAGGHIEMVRWLVINCADLQARTKQGYTVIHMAAQGGHKQCLMVLHAIGARLDVVTYNKRTPLHVAAVCGHRDCCEWLVDSGVDPRVKDKQGRTALDLAEEMQHSDIVDYLRTKTPRPPGEKNKKPQEKGRSTRSTGRNSRLARHVST